MENNRNVSNVPYDYVDHNNYSSFSRPVRTETFLPKISLCKPPNGNKTYCKDHDNFPESYSDEKLWQMEPRVLNSSYSSFSSPRQTPKQFMANSQIQNNIPKKNKMPLKGILLNRQCENNLEGNQRNDSSQGNNTLLRPISESPSLNYRLPAYKSNENLMSAFCDRKPVSEIDGSQYYLINKEKTEDYSILTEGRNLYKEPNVYEYNTLDNDMYYESSLHESATLDLRNEPNQTFSQNTYSTNYANPEGSAYENSESDYLVYHQSTLPGSSQVFNQNRYQYVPRSRNFTQSAANRRDIYKHVSEKLDETFIQLKNAGISDKRDENRFQRSSNINAAERYSMQESIESNKKTIQNTQEDYHYNKMEYNKKDAEPFKKRQYKFQELVEVNSKKPAMMSCLEKFKLGNQNELINTSLRFPSCKTQEEKSNIKRKMVEIIPSKQKGKEQGFEKSGSFVHRHKEYNKNQSVPGCCVDVYNDYRKDSIPNNVLK